MSSNLSSYRSSKKDDARSMRKMFYSMFEVINGEKKCYGGFVSNLAISPNIYENGDEPYLRIKIKGVWEIHRTKVLFIEPRLGFAILDFSHKYSLSLLPATVSLVSGDEVYLFDISRKVGYLSEPTLVNHVPMFTTDQKCKLGTFLLDNEGFFVGMCTLDDSFLTYQLMKRPIQFYKDGKNLTYGVLPTHRMTTFEDAILYKLSTIQGFVSDIGLLLSVSSNSQEYKLGLDRGMYSIIYIEQRLEPGTKVKLTYLTLDGKNEKVVIL